MRKKREDGKRGGKKREKGRKEGRKRRKVVVRSAFTTWKK